jgi:hypothetical protein
MMAKRALAPALGALLLLGGCGGGGQDTASTAAPGTTQQATSASPQRHPSAAAQHEASPGPGKGQGSAQAKAPSHSKQATATVRVPPISTAPVAGSKAPAPGVKTVRGADNSVQTYGTESGQDERTAAAIALQAYLNARLAGDWASACSDLARRAKDELDKLAQQLKGQGKDVAGCTGTMSALEGGSSQSQQRPGVTIGEVLSFRGGGEVPGDPSYLIFTGPPAATLYSMPMYLEGGGWKVGLALPSELPV